MDNSGRSPLRVPGIGLPLRYELPPENRFAHGVAEWRQSPAITELEITMVRIMNDITDLPDWHITVFEDDVISKHWLPRFSRIDEYHLMTERCWDWCLRELRDKAVEFRTTHFVRVLDTGSVLCKSDSLVPADLLSELASSTGELFAEELSCRRRVSSQQPSAGLVYPVDPQLYPLIYGKTPVMQDGGTTTLDCLFGSHYANVASVQDPIHPKYGVEREQVQARLRAGPPDEDMFYYVQVDGREYSAFLKNARQYFHSPRSQCLPCEVIGEDTGTNSVRIASYITGLHPRRSPTVYKEIERLISLALEPWNACLMNGHRLPNNQIRTAVARSGYPQSGRIPARITSFGHDWVNDLPLIALSFNKDYPRNTPKSHPPIPEEYDGDSDRIHYNPQALFQSVTEIPPSPTPAAWRWAEEYLQRSDDNGVQSSSSTLPQNWKAAVWHHITDKALRRQNVYFGRYVRTLRRRTVRSVRQYLRTLEPGLALSYEDWRAGRFSDPLMATIFTLPLHYRGWELPLQSDTPDEKLSGPYYQGPILDGIDSIRIQDYLQKDGFQVFVRIAGIELTPDKPQHDACPWTLQGTLSEHIVATAMIVLDIENVSACFVEFLQETPRPHADLEHAYTSIPSMATMPAKNAFFESQTIGKVELQSGRLITFPNTMQHRITACQLINSSRSGHVRFIYIDLVDPHYRICSTRNVPAQQAEWWEEEVFEILHAKLPAELCELVVEQCRDVRFSREQAEENRKAVLEDMDLMHCAKYWHMDAAWELSLEELEGPPS